MVGTDGQDDPVKGLPTSSLLCLRGTGLFYLPDPRQEDPGVHKCPLGTAEVAGLASWPGWDKGQTGWLW